MSLRHSVSRRLAPTVAAALLLAGCSREDPRLANLSVSISKDSVITAMGGERPARTDPYLTGGQYIEAMYFNPPGGVPQGADTIPDRDRTPVIVVNGLVTGWGWVHWDSVATAHRIPVAAKD